MKTETRVIAISDDQKAELAVHRDTACGDCATCGGCDAGTVRVTVDNTLRAAVGDTVTIETSTGTVILIAVLVYLLPLVLFFAGYAIGAALGVQPLLLGGIGFAVSLLAAVLVNRKLTGKLKYRMTGFAVSEK